MAGPFPTEHPLVRNPDGSYSNVLTFTSEMDGRHYVFPSMVGGRKLSGVDAVRVAKEQGLHRYPSFDTGEEALAASISLHGQQTPPLRHASEGALFPIGNQGAVMAEPTANQQWWTPEFAQQTDADAKAAALSAIFAQAIEQGTVTPSHQTPYASGAAEPVYPVEGAIGGAAVGGLSRVAINALLEMAAKNARSAEVARLEKAYGPRPESPGSGAFARNVEGRSTPLSITRQRDPQTGRVRFEYHSVSNPIAARDNINWHRYQGWDSRTPPVSEGPIHQLALGAGRGLKDTRHRAEVTPISSHPSYQQHATTEGEVLAALKELRRQGRIRQNPDGTWELIP